MSGRFTTLTNLSKKTGVLRKTHLPVYFVLVLLFFLGV